MKLFRKISAIAASALMVGMSAGIAAAANYPSPFVVGGSADVAIVYGSDSPNGIDIVPAGNIQTNLQSHMGTSTDGTTTTSGEIYALDTGSDRIYMNDTLDNVNSLVTSTDMPTALADTTFSGAADGTSTKSTTVSHTIEIGDDARLEFDQQPSPSTEPGVVWDLPTTASASSQIFNLTVDFDNAINFTDTDSHGEEITLFGKAYTVGASTTNTSLYLLGASDKVSLEVGTGATGSSSATVTVDGEEYTVELMTASDSDAKISITDSSGDSKTKTISQDTSATLLGVDVTVSDPFSSTPQNTEGADVSVGTGQVLLKDGSSVKVTSDEDTVTGTNVVFDSGLVDITSISIQVSAEDASSDGINEGEEFVDPVFEAVKLMFPGLNIPLDSSDRETISIKTTDDRATISFTTDDGESLSDFNWYYNASNSGGVAELGDSEGNDIHVVEGANISTTENGTEYVVVGNENTGHLLQLTTLTNLTDGYSDDEVIFTDQASGKEHSPTISSEGSGTMKIGGTSYTVTYVKLSGNEYGYVFLDYDGTAGKIDVYPTIETSKGAKLAFYEPLNISLNNVDGANADASEIALPNGDGFSTFSVSSHGNDSWKIDSKVVNTSLDANGTTLSAGELTYVINGSAANQTQIRLRDVDGSEIDYPGIILFEEQDDDNSNYEALIVKMSDGGTVSVSDVEDTWNSDSRPSGWKHEVQLESDTDLYREMNLWGTIVTVDQSDSDNHDAEISYPDEQVYAQMYLGASDASVSGVTSTTSSSEQLGDVLVKDSEVSSVSSKNLIVVGGSCVNSVAANLLGGAYCGSSFTDNTDVGSGQFLIQSFGDAYTSGKVALLVAGYEAADTVNAATYLRTQTVDATAGKKYKGTSSTSAELVTEESSE